MAVSEREHEGQGPAAQRRPGVQVTAGSNFLQSSRAEASTPPRPAPRAPPRSGPAPARHVSGAEHAGRRCLLPGRGFRAWAAGRAGRVGGETAARKSPPPPGAAALPGRCKQVGEETGYGPGRRHPQRLPRQCPAGGVCSALLGASRRLPQFPPPLPRRWRFPRAVTFPLTHTQRLAGVEESRGLVEAAGVFGGAAALLGKQTTSCSDISSEFFLDGARGDSLWGAEQMLN